MLPIKFQDNRLFVSGEEEKNRFFQDGGHLGFPIGTLLAFFYLQVTPMLLTSFLSVGDHNHTYIGTICILCSVKNGPFIIRKGEKRIGYKINVKKRKAEKTKKGQRKKIRWISGETQNYYKNN